MKGTDEWFVTESSVRTWDPMRDNSDPKKPNTLNPYVHNGTIETEKVADTLSGMEFQSVLGPVRIRKFDNQGTTPLWTGKAAWDDELKIGVLTEILKLPTEAYLPTEEDVKLSRQ